MLDLGQVGPWAWLERSGVGVNRQVGLGMYKPGSLVALVAPSAGLTSLTSPYNARIMSLGWFDFGYGSQTYGLYTHSFAGCGYDQARLGVLGGADMVQVRGVGEESGPG